MDVLVLHILKLNIIAAVVILLVKVLATLFKGRVSARWEVLYLAVDYDKPLCSGAPSGESGTGGFQST